MFWLVKGKKKVTEDYNQQSELEERRGTLRRSENALELTIQQLKLRAIFGRSFLERLV
jgi:hypothetical protein